MARDDCDPGPDQVRSKMLSFVTVFAAQILAVLLSKVILTRKMRKVRGPPPLIGEHTADVMSDLGFDDAAVERK
jgi:crotonobetainyl-CoA:carnitine CoA-transferase CaiB-like acyl-CoA transferase